MLRASNTHVRGYLILASLIVASPALAQESAGQTRRLEDVVVTSTLRAENVQDIPLTVSVLDSAQLLKADIYDATGIAVNTPGLAYGEFSPGQALFTMRGVGSSDDGAGLDNSVALFLDGVYIGRGAGVNFDMFDLERIEVLKGPQGTLFGRNTIGGAISVITKKPGKENSAQVQATLGNKGIVRAQGYVNGALSEQLAGKLVVNYRKHDGFVRNTLLKEDLNNENYISTRGQLRYEADRFDWLLSADYMKDDRNHAGRVPRVNGNYDYLSLLETLEAGTPQTSASPTDGFTKRTAWGSSLQGDIDLGPGKLTSITAYRRVDSDWEMPSIGAPAGGGYNLDSDPIVYGVDVVDDILEEVTTISQELRWASQLDGPLSYVLGAYYFIEDTDRIEQFRLDRTTETSGTRTQIVVGNEYTRTENKTTSYALYGQANWDFSASWSAVIGARYTNDEKDYTATAVNCGQAEAERAAAGFANFLPCQDVGSSLSIINETFKESKKQSWSDFSPMGSLQYRASEEVMLFGTVSTGFKSGGFAGSQGIRVAATTPVQPEKATNFELGMKSDLLDGTLRFNATAFFTSYQDLQVVRFGPVPESDFGTFVTRNGEADIYGGEIEWVWQMSDAFAFRGNYAYLNTNIKKLLLPAGNEEVDVSGKNLLRAPPHSYNIIAEYVIPLANSGGDLDLNLQFTHMDGQSNDYVNDAAKADPKDLLDARIGWRSKNGKWNVAIWGKNLTDQGYISHVYVIGPGVIGIWGAPRTFGVTATATY